MGTALLTCSRATSVAFEGRLFESPRSVISVTLRDQAPREPSALRPGLLGRRWSSRCRLCPLPDTRKEVSGRNQGNSQDVVRTQRRSASSYPQDGRAASCDLRQAPALTG